MSNPTSNFGWQMPTATDLVTDLPADFEVFGQAVDTDFADLNGGTTGQLLSKTSATDLDFTWVTPNAGDITGVTAGTGISGGGTSGDVTVTNSMATAFTTSGDLIQATGSGTFARLGTGTNGQYLTTNGTTNSWGTISAGGMTLLSTTTLSGTSTTISSISGAYNNLLAVIYGVQVNSATEIRINPNSNTGYALAMIYGSGATTPATTTQIKSGSPITTAYPADVAFYFELINYASTASSKPFEFYGNSDSGNYSSAEFGTWNRTNAVTSLQITTANGTSTFSAGTVLLYGVK